MAYESGSGKDVCEQCGNEYQNIGSHWSQSESCEYPPLSQRQMEIVTGLLMGDGCMSRDGKYPRIVATMISPNYLKYIDEKLGVFAHGVSKVSTAEESAARDRKSGFNSSAESGDYSDAYRWRSMRHPDLQSLAEWYDSGKKVWPDDIELTPTVLKHWYCGDGTHGQSGPSNYIRIAMTNSSGHRDKVDEYFNRVGLPTPDNYIIGERELSDSCTCNASWGTEPSSALWSYMGEPLPDFEYKWPEAFRSNSNNNVAAAV